MVIFNILISNWTIDKNKRCPYLDEMFVLIGAGKDNILCEIIVWVYF